MYKRFIIVADDFYKNADSVSDFAKKQKYRSLQIATGFRSNMIYQEDNMKQRFEKILNMQVNRWSTEKKSENGIFFYAFSQGKLKEKPAIHTDSPFTEVTAVIYLTPNVPFDCGTSFWKHKKTGIEKAPDGKDSRRLKIRLKDLQQMLENDATHRSKWVETDRISYRYNRMIAFSSGYFHSATSHFGNSVDNGRIIQTFRIGVDWSTYQSCS